MITYKLLISYDGTDFEGWQWQPQAPSIVQTMQSSFAALFGKQIKLIGASRTDSGVHALGQVALCKTDIAVDASKMMQAWNDALPPTIVIRSLQPIDDAFHPMYGVDYKIYWYHFFLERPLPFVQRYGWFCRHNVDMDVLQELLNVFVGTHDFRSFCTGTDMGQNTVRTIQSITVSKEMFGAWRIAFKGPGFMRHMIRRIVGACLQAASKQDISAAHMRSILEQKNPNQSLFNAPAQGLCLQSIRYKET